MLDLANLTNSLDVGEGQGIDTLDPRFQDIASLIEQADFATAANKCQEAFSEVGGDVRLIAWFYFGLFLQDGVKALGPSLASASSIFRDHIDKVGPERKKDRHATAGMTWFLSKLADRVTSDDEDLMAETEKLTQAATLEEAVAGVDAVNELWEVFPAAFPAPDPQKVTSQLRRVREWLDGLVAALTPPPEPEVPDEPEASEEAQPSGEGGAPIAVGGGPAAGVQVDASPQLAQLQARIAAFERLIEHGDVAKAAVIAADVMDAIRHFDPRVYFPRLIGGFFAQYARQADKVFEWQEKRGSAPWQIYDQLYRTNLEGFVRCNEGDLQRMLAAVPDRSPPPPPPAPAPEYHAPQPSYQAPPRPAAPPPADDDDDDEDW